MMNKDKLMAEFKEKLALYSTDLITTLNKCDIVAFKEFVIKWYNEKLIDDKTYNATMNADEETLMNSYCALILGSKKTTDNAKEWAKENKAIGDNNA